MIHRDHYRAKRGIGKKVKAQSKGIFYGQMGEKIGIRFPDTKTNRDWPVTWTTTDNVERVSVMEGELCHE